MASRGQDRPTPSSDAETRAAAVLSAFRPGDVLCNRFRVVRFIARGGMGELYEAEDLTLGERVALKMIRPEIARDERATQRFLREVQLARKVTHPNICRIFDLFEHVAPGAGPPAPPPAALVTMELLHGETIAQRLQRKGPFSIADALVIARQMAAALTAAHAAGIIHRDFKSNNVMLLDARGSQPLRVVVTDFGLAHRVDEHGAVDSAITATGDVVGTPDYMAPEQVEGKPLTPATDVYALGIVLYEMVTGSRPFVAESPFAAALQRVTGPPPTPPREVNPAVPVAWDRAVMRCLARRPEDRFQDAMAVVEALGADTATSARPQAPRRWTPLVAGMLIVAAVVTLVWALDVPGWLTRVRSTPAVAADPAEALRPAVAVLGFRNLTGRDDVQWLSTALSEMLTTELGAAERLRAVPGENVNRVKTELSLADADAYNAETLARIRRNLGADIVVSGSYVTVGDGDDATLRVDIRIQDAQKGETTSLVSESGRSAELLEVVARAGTQLRERLGVSVSPAGSLRASQPASSEAARLYAEGLMRLRRFDALGARTLLEQAVQADPKFPLAHSALANTWFALGYDSRAKEAAGRAFDLSASLPRADRLLVEGTFHEMSSEWPRAIGIWQTLSTFFPDDVEYVLRLANAQIVSGEAKDGLATIEAFKKQFPRMADPRLDLAEAQAAETLSDFKRMQAAAAAAAAAGQAQGATLLVATARMREGEANLRSGQIDRAVGLFDEARGMYAEAGDKAGVARALTGLANAIGEGPDTKRVRALYDEALATARAIGKQDLVASVLNNIAIQERRAGNLQASLKMNQEALAIRRDIGDRTNTSVSLNNIGNVLLDLGNLQGASAHYEESASMSREMGDRRSTARALFNAGVAFKQQGEIVRSRAVLEESLKIRREISDPAGIATSFLGLGELAVVQGDLAAAKQSLNEALEMDRKLDRRRPMAYSLFELAEIAFLEGDAATARHRHQEALDLRLALGEHGTAAESRAALAVLALQDGNAAEAEALAGGAATVFASQSAPGNEATARATHALALQAQGRGAAARAEVERAQRLVRNPQQVLFRLPVMIASAQVAGMSNPTGALKTLEGIRADAAGRGMPRFEFDARRAMAEIEVRRSPAAGATMKAALQKDAAARGFHLYAR